MPPYNLLLPTPTRRKSAAEFALKLSSPLSLIKVSSPELPKNLEDDNGEIDVSDITISLVSPTCSVRSLSVNNFSSKVSSPSVIRSLSNLWLKFNFPFFTIPYPSNSPPTTSSLSIPVPSNFQYNFVFSGTSLVLILVFKIPPSAIDDCALIA